MCLNTCTQNKEISMNLRLAWARRPRKIGGGGGGVISCPNCARIYDPLAKLEDWGIAVHEQLVPRQSFLVAKGRVVSFPICGNCLNDPASIDTMNIIWHINAQNSSPGEGQQAIVLLQDLQRGAVTAEQIAFCSA
jgi:hypothetical protein